jgi:hypothetical protein
MTDHELVSISELGAWGPEESWDATCSCTWRRQGCASYDEAYLRFRQHVAVQSDKES